MLIEFIVNVIAVFFSHSARFNGRLIGTCAFLGQTVGGPPGVAFGAIAGAYGVFIGGGLSVALRRLLPSGGETRWQR